jgi:transcriptional regulator with XRE-family HTH domain
MARAALEWDMKDLAEAAAISTNTVARFENGRNTPNPVTLKAMRQAFEAAGLMFIDTDETAAEGVRLSLGLKPSAEEEKPAEKLAKPKKAKAAKEPEAE